MYLPRSDWEGLVSLDYVGLVALRTSRVTMSCPSSSTGCANPALTSYWFAASTAGGDGVPAAFVGSPDGSAMGGPVSL